MIVTQTHFQNKEEFITARRLKHYKASKNPTVPVFPKMSLTKR